MSAMKKANKVSFKTPGSCTFIGKYLESTFSYVAVFFDGLDDGRIITFGSYLFLSVTYFCQYAHWIFIVNFFLHPIVMCQTNNKRIHIYFGHLDILCGTVVACVSSVCKVYMDSTCTEYARPYKKKRDSAGSVPSFQAPETRILCGHGQHFTGRVFSSGRSSFVPQSCKPKPNLDVGNFCGFWKTHQIGQSRLFSIIPIIRIPLSSSCLPLPLVIDLLATGQCFKKFATPLGSSAS